MARYSIPRWENYLAPGIYEGNNMKYDLSEFEKRVEQGLLRKSEWKDLVLFNYTDSCTFSRSWDEYTTIARGLILDKNTGEVISKPFEKFFNLFETEATSLKNLPNLPYTVSAKEDGSFGQVFYYDGKWNVATRGSFYSDQAIKAQELLKNYNLSGLQKDITLLVEIIYPQNRIVVNYGDREELVVLGAYFRDTCEEWDPDEVVVLARMLGMPYAKSYNYTIPQMIELQKTLPKDQEGFVVRYSNGFRLKIKSDEYMRIAKLMANLSPIALWESMINGKVDQKYLQQLPEELRKDYGPYVEELERQYKIIYDEITHTALDRGFFVRVCIDSNWRKFIGLYLSNNKVKHSSAMFPLLLGNQEALEKYIMKQIGPTGNEMRLIE